MDQQTLQKHSSPPEAGIRKVLREEYSLIYRMRPRSRCRRGSGDEIRGIPLSLR